MKLPPSLVPWRVQLERFPEEVALALAPLVQRLAAAVGPLASAYLGTEQPDGFDGVSPRGEYQRLLASEWLLADEEPDEFLRRAAMREHLFLRLSQRDPQGSKRCIALFDAGPSQLGSPRLAHIAMLAVLERRALAAGAEFEFGVLQSPEPARRAADVQHLLNSRSPLEASAAQIARWMELLQPLAAEDEVWWVGGPRLGQPLAGRRGPRMFVRDPLRAENDRLEVELHVRERRQQVLLQLPEPQLRTRIMRNPLAQVELRNLPAPLSHDFRFSPDGRRLLVIESPLVYAYLTSRGPVGAPRVFRTPEVVRLAAVTWHRRHFAAVVRGSGGWFMLIGGEQFPIGFLDRRPAAPLGDSPPCQLILQGKSGENALLLDMQGTLFRGQRRSDGGYRFQPILDSVVRLERRPGYYFYAARANAGVSVGKISDQFGIGSQRSEAAVADPVVFSVCHPTTQLGAFAVQVTRDKPHTKWPRCRWAIHGPSAKPEHVEIHNDHEVLGLIAGPDDRTQAHDFRLLVRLASTSSLMAVGVRGTDPLPGMTGVTGEVVVSPRRGCLAYRTASGHICVRQLWAKEQPYVVPGGGRQK